MKTALLAAAIAAFAGTAFAADLPPAHVPVKAVAPPPIASWTGCYLGAGAGYDVWNQDHVTTFGGVGATARTTTGGRGWFGTAQLGCDYQFDANWVVGVFGDGNWGNMKGDFQDSGFQLYGKEKEKWSWAAGGRVGYLINPNFMGFFTAGWSEGHFDQINLINAAGAFSNIYPSHTYSGWFLGSGYEYRLPWLPGFTWKTEYRFTDFGNDNLTLLTAAAVPTAFGMNSHKYEQTIRSELVWRFNGWQ